MVCDCIIVLLLFVSLIYGWRKGFVHCIYSAFSMIISIVVSYLFTDMFSVYLAESSFGYELASKISDIHPLIPADKCVSIVFLLISSILLYFIVRIVLKVICKFLEKLASLPLIRTVNNFLGLVLNGILGTVWIVILINLFYVLPGTHNFIVSSQIADYFSLIIV